MPDNDDDDEFDWAEPPEWGAMFYSGAQFALPAGQEDAEAIALGLGALAGWSPLRRTRSGRWSVYPMRVDELLQHSAPDRRQPPSIEACLHALGYFEGANPGLPPGDFTRSLIAAIVLADPGNHLALQGAFPDLVGAVTLYTRAEDGRDWLARRCAEYRRDQLAALAERGGSTS